MDGRDGVGCMGDGGRVGGWMDGWGEKMDGYGEV